MPSPAASDALAPAPASPWRDLRLRALSAAVLIPVAIGALWAGDIAWLALVIAANLALLWEWVRMCRRRPGPLAIPAMLAGVIYFGVNTAALLTLRAAPETGFANVLYLLLLVWASDIGAYLAGRALGGPKLAPAISPGKTWSGAAGGLLAALVVALLFGASPTGLALAAGLSIASMLGDLAESAAKRYYGVKDSSQLIPGHGGVFDRLDGVLAAAPLAALALHLHAAGPHLWR